MSADLVWTRRRLANWGAWSRVGRHVATCYSAEGRYRPERLLGDTEDDRRRARTEVDIQDALAVWRAILPIYGMPLGLALVLHGVYVRRLRDESLRAWLRRRKMHIRGRDLASVVYEAELAAHNRLARYENT